MPQGAKEGDVALLANLSPREKEVFYLLAQGLSNEEIGQRLFIGDKTVKNYATKIRKKLALANRTQIALFAVKHHLINLN